MWPSRPISTALSVPWPRPVSASEPNTSARTRATCGKLARCFASQFCAKRAAARIGPTVCEELGPMPILNRSKVLTAMGSRDCLRGALILCPSQPRYPNAATMRLSLFQRDDCPLCDVALAVLAAARRRISSRC